MTEIRPECWKMASTFSLEPRDLLGSVFPVPFNKAFAFFASHLFLFQARGPIGKRFDNVQTHSFEILASVAGNLLDKTKKCSNTDTRLHPRTRVLHQELLDRALQNAPTPSGIKDGIHINASASQGEALELGGPFSRLTPDVHENSKQKRALEVKAESDYGTVKLSIESFKVPELFIDISTNATVGSLKRTVMKVVTSILGDGLHVGILVQGKKVRDDNKTLIQTGISQDDKSHHNLGFVLEPKHSRTTTLPTSFKNEPLLSRARSHDITRHCAPLALQQGTSLHPQSKKNLEGFGGTELSAVKSVGDSKSLMSMKALAVVSLHHKPPGTTSTGSAESEGPSLFRKWKHWFGRLRSLELGGWLIFSVIFATKQNVTLFDHRWRDVKFHAFENAKHRTYVDLKDKWMTLVHTARISPQQRRGELVPHELLDRVLAAQTYWSHRQAKQYAMITI